MKMLASCHPKNTLIPRHNPICSVSQTKGDCGDKRN